MLRTEVVHLPARAAVLEVEIMEPAPPGRWRLRVARWLLRLAGRLARLEVRIREPDRLA